MSKKFIRPDLRTEEQKDEPGIVLFFRRIGSYFRDRSLWRGVAVVLAMILLIAALIAAIIGVVRFFRTVPSAPSHGTTLPPITTPPTTDPGGQPPVTTLPPEPPVTTLPPEPPVTTLPPVTPDADLDLSINGGLGAITANIPDFMPGDSATTICAVEVAHKVPARLSLYSVIGEGSSKKFADAIRITISLPNENEVLWTGSLSEMHFEMTFDGSTESTYLILAITASIPGSLGNEYQGLSVEARYYGLLEPIS